MAMKIDEIEIVDQYDETGIMFADGEQSWDIDHEEAKLIAWACEGARLLKRRVFVGKATEVTE